jgi:hypothetical protein
MFKNRFIGALGTMDSNFPVQLWDMLAPQVQDSINLLRQSCINPKHSAYKALEGLYDWNQYPMAPPGMKAIIYNNASRAHHGHHAASMHGYLVPPKTTTAATYTTYLRPLVIVYQALQTYSHNTGLPPFSNETHVNELSEEIQDTLTKLMRQK